MLVELLNALTEHIHVNTPHTNSVTSCSEVRSSSPCASPVPSAQDLNVRPAAVPEGERGGWSAPGDHNIRSIAYTAPFWPHKALQSLVYSLQTSGWKCNFFSFSFCLKSAWQIASLALASLTWFPNIAMAFCCSKMDWSHMESIQKH